MELDTQTRQVIRKAAIRELLEAGEITEDEAAELLVELTGSKRS